MNHDATKLKKISIALDASFCFCRNKSNVTDQQHSHGAQLGLRSFSTERDDRHCLWACAVEYVQRSSAGIWLWSVLKDFRLRSQKNNVIPCQLFHDEIGISLKMKTYSFVVPHWNDFQIQQRKRNEKHFGLKFLSYVIAWWPWVLNKVKFLILASGDFATH